MMVVFCTEAAAIEAMEDEDRLVLQAVASAHATVADGTVLRVIVVDNGSTDRSIEIAESMGELAKAAQTDLEQAARQRPARDSLKSSTSRRRLRRRPAAR